MDLLAAMRAPRRTATVGLLLAAVVAGCAVGPRPLSEEQIAQLATESLQHITARQEPVTGPISLHEAMARALKYNLDYRLEMAQATLRAAESGLAGAQMLPQLVAKAGLSGRDSYLSLAKLDLPSGIEIPAQSTAQDKEVQTEDITFSWNILDFALSYVRANQAADRYLIAEETKRKIVQRIIEDTRSAYWRAVSADRMAKKLAATEKRAMRAIANARDLQRGAEVAPVMALTFERDLVEIQQTLQKLQREHAVAKSQLAALMDVAPGTEFTLSGRDGGIAPPVLGMSAREMIAEALFNRAEMHELAYEQRINEREAAAALLELLPGINIYTAENFDSNHLLLHDQWQSWGATAAWNLMRVTQVPARRRLIEARDELIQTKSLATTMVIMTQVYVSRVRHQHFARELETAKEFLDVQAKLVQHLRATAEADAIGEQTLIREELNLLVAEAKRDVMFANLHTSAANVFTSMGLDLQASEIDYALPVKELASRLATIWSSRGGVSQRGRYLAEVAQAKADAKRVLEEEARRIKQEELLRQRQASVDQRQGSKRIRGSLKDDEPEARSQHRGGSIKDDAPEATPERNEPVIVGPYRGLK